MSFTLLSHGAEAKIYRYKDFVIKYRLSKSYRLPEIDKKLIEKRTKNETTILNKLSHNGILVPKLYDLSKINQNKTEDTSKKVNVHTLQEDCTVNSFSRENTIVMEFLEGCNLKDYTENATEEEKKKVYTKLGILMEKIHNLNIIHGDITTLNFIIKNDEIYAIDFGLSCTSNKDENKAVDLYVFERAAVCSHGEKIMEYFYDGYKTDSVLKKLIEVRKRGRKREESAIG